MSIADDFATLRAACPYPHERAAIYRIEFELLNNVEAGDPAFRGSSRTAVERGDSIAEVAGQSPVPGSQGRPTPASTIRHRALRALGLKVRDGKAVIATP